MVLLFKMDSFHAVFSLTQVQSLLCQLLGTVELAVEYAGDFTKKLVCVLQKLLVLEKVGLSHLEVVLCLWSNRKCLIN